MSEIHEVARGVQEKDVLNADFINSRPWMVKLIGHSDCTYDLLIIDVQTGCARIDVCGKSQNIHIGDVSKFVDWDGNEFEIDEFYLGDENDHN